MVIKPYFGLISCRNLTRATHFLFFLVSLFNVRSISKLSFSRTLFFYDGWSEENCVSFLPCAFKILHKTLNTTFWNCVVVFDEKPFRKYSMTTIETLSLELVVIKKLCSKILKAIFWIFRLGLSALNVFFEPNVVF